MFRTTCSSTYAFLFLGLLVLGQPSFGGDDEATCQPEGSLARMTNEASQISGSLEGPLREAETYFALACRTLPKLPKVPNQKDLEQYHRDVKEGLSSQIPLSTLGTRIPTVDGKGRKTMDFLTLVSQKVEQKHKTNLDMARRMRACSQSPIDSKCEPAVEAWLKNDLPALASAARHALALAVPDRDPSSNSAKDDTRLNKTLKPLGTTKVIDWEPLTASEETRANEDLHQIIREISRPSSRGNPENKELPERRRQLLEARELSFLVYFSLIGIHPVLQNLSTANPTKKEIYLGTQKALEALEVEKSNLEKAKTSLLNPYSLGRSGVKTYSDEALLLMKYRVEVEEVLMEHPEYCGLGLSLRQIEENKKSTLDAFEGLAFAGSWLVGPWAALAVGAGSSAISAASDWSDYRESQLRLAARLQNGNTAELSELLKSKNEDSRTNLGLDISAVYRQQLFETRQQEVKALTLPINTAVLMGPAIFKYTKPFLTKFILLVKSQGH